jgi:hypothetical protein
MSAASRWTENVRCDGVRVERAPVRTKGGDDAWIVRSPAQHFPILHCPCCGALMTNAGAAKRVADEVFPLKGAGK